MNNQSLTIQEAAAFLGVSTKTLRRWDTSGRLVPERTAGNQRRYTLSELEKFKATSPAIASTEEIQESQSPIQTPSQIVSEVLPLTTVQPQPAPSFSNTVGEDAPDSEPKQQAFETPASEPFVPQLQSSSPAAEKLIQSRTKDIKSYFQSVFHPNPTMAFAAVLSAVLLFFFMHFGFNSDQGTFGFFLADHKDTNANRQVLAASDAEPAYVLNVNVPGIFGKKVSFLDAAEVKESLTVDGKAVLTGGVETKNANIDAGTGRLTASNVIYSIRSGQNVQITGDPQNPIISAQVTGGVVSSLQGQSGALTFNPGDGISLDGLSIRNTGVLSVQGQTGSLTFTGGSGITVSGTTISNSDTGSAQNIFKNFTIDGTTTIAAGSNTDTINFAAGSGITLTGNAGSKTITITGTGGASLSGLTPNGVVYGNTTTTVATTTPGATGTVLKGVTGGPPVFSALDLTTDVTGSLPVSNGGTGANSFTANGILYGNGTGQIQVTSPPGSGQVLLGNGSGVPTFTALSGDLAVNGAGVTTIQADAVSLGSDTTGNYQLGTTAGNGISVSGAAGEGWSPTIAINLSTSGTTSTTSSNSGLEVGPTGLSLLRGCSNGQILKWNATSGQWECNADAGGGGGSTAIINVTGNGFSSNDTSTLNYSNDFVLTESPLTQTNVSIDYTTSHIVRDNQSQTITGIWGFANQLGIGTSTPIAPLDIEGAYGSNAALVVNQKNSGDIFTASASGTTKFTIANSGAITAAGSISGLTGINSSGTIIFSGLGTGVVHSSSGTLSTSAVTNAELQNSSITITTSTGLSGGGAVSLGGSLTLTNTGVTSLTGTTNQIAVSGSTGSVTLSLPQDINTTSSPTFNGLTVSSLTRGSDTITDFTGTGLQVSGGALQTTLGTSVDLTSEVNGVLPVGNGGTGLSTFTTGDLIYASGSNTLAARSIGSNGQVLTVVGGVPTWSSAGGTINYWQENLGVVAPYNITDDLVIGATATSSAKFQVSGTTGNLTAAGTVTFSSLGTGVVHSSSGALSVGAVTNAELQNSSVTINTGTGLSGGGSLSLGGTLSLSNTGVTSLTGTANQVTVSGSTGSVTLSLPQDINTTSSPTFNGLTVSSLTRGSDTITDFTGTGLQMNSGALETTLGTSVDLTAEVTGVLPTANGGTGQNFSSTAQGSIIYFSGSGVMSALAPGTAGFVLQTNGAGANPTWVNAASLGTNYFQRNNGAISPVNITDDLLLGATATSSAKFAFLNNSGNGTPTASISGTTNGSSLYVTGDGVLATTNKQSLTIGSSSTGNIILNGFTAGVLKTNASGVIANGAVNLASSEVTGTLAMGNGGTGATSFTSNGVIYGNGSGALQVTSAGTNGQLFLGVTSGAPTFATLGGDATITNTGNLTLKNTGTAGTYGDAATVPVFTTDAQGRVTGVTNTAIAIDASQIVSGTIPFARGGTNNSASYTAGSVVFSDGTKLTQDNSNFFYDGTNGLLGLGTSAPISRLHVTGAIAGKALSIFNYTGTDQNIIVASKSGTTQFAVNNNGNVQFTGNSGFLNTLTSVATAGRTYTLPDTTGTICLVEAGNCAGSGSGVTTPGGTTNRLVKFTGSQSVGNASINDLYNNVALTISALGNVGVGAATSPNALLQVTGGTTGGNAALIVDQTGASSNDIFAASASGTTKFVINNNGNLQFTGNSGFFNTLTSAATANQTINIPNLSGSDTVCFVSLGNCAGSGGGLTGSGTAGQIAFFNGSGSLTSETSGFAWDATNNKLGIGNDSPVAKLDLQGAVTGKALAIFNETGNQDIFTASASGATKLTLSNAGNLNIAGTYYANGTAGITQGTASCVTTTNGIVTGFGTCQLGSEQWVVNNGAIYTGVPSLDLLLGGTSTSSARFAVTNMIGNGTPTASLSAGVAGGASFGANGLLQTTNKQSLTIGSTSTGNIILDSGNGVVQLADYTTNGGLLFTDATGVISQTGAGTTGQILKSNGGGAPTWVDAASVGTNYFQRNSGSVAPINVTDDLLIGSAATGSAKFRASGTNGDLFAAGTVTFSGLSNGVLHASSGVLSTSAVTNAELQNSSITITTSTGLSGGGSVSLGGSLTLTNTGVTSLAGTANQVTVSGATGAVTLSLPQDINTTSSPTFNGLTVSSLTRGSDTITDFTGTGLQMNAGALETTLGTSVDLTSEVTGVLPTANGGTGQNFSSTAQGSIIYFSAAGTMSALAPGTAGYVLQTNGAGQNPTWVNAASLGTNYFQRNNGAVSPVNITDDLLVGGTSTASAKFAFINNTGSGTPTASISGTTANVATYIDGNGNIGTTNKQPLTIGSSSTGSINFTPGGVSTLVLSQAGTVNVTGSLLIAGSTSLTRATNLIINGTNAANAGIIFDISGSVERARIDGTNGNFGIGTASPLTTLHVNGANSAGRAAFIVDQTASSANDIFAASSSGTTKFRIANDGTLTDTAYTTGGGLLYTNGSGTIAQSTAGTAGQVLLSGGSGAPTWTTGTLSLAGNFTTSGASALTLTTTGATNVTLPTSGTLATLAGTESLTNKTVNGLTLTANADGFSVAGGTTSRTLNVTGSNITLTGGGNTLTLTGNASLNQDLLTTSSPTFANITDSGLTANAAVYTNGSKQLTTTAPTSGVIGYIQRNSGALSPANITDDLLLGGISTASAKFAFINNIGSGTPTASISGTTTGVATYLDGNGNFGTTKASTLTLGGASTGNINLTPGNGSGFVKLNAAGFMSGSSETFSFYTDYESYDRFRFSNSVNDSILRLTSNDSGARQGLDIYHSAGSYYGFVGFNNGMMQLMGQAGRQLSLGANGTDYVRLTTDGLLGLNTTNPIATLDIRGSSSVFPVASISGTTVSAGLIVNNNGTGDLFTASKSGATKFTILNNGNIQLNNYTNNTGILYTNGSGVVSQTASGTNGQVLQMSGGTPTWVDAGAAGIGYLQKNAGAISPIAITDDFLLGGIATASAKFAFINNTGAGVPTASISANTGNNATYLTGAGVLGTTNEQTLTIGSSSTGNIVLNGFGAGLVHSNASGVLSSSAVALNTSDVTGTLGVGNGGTGLTSYTTGDLIYASGTNTLANRAIGSTGQVLSVVGGLPTWVDPAALSSTYWQRNNGAVAPSNITDDLLLGSTATASAKVAFTGIAGGTPTASISAGGSGALSMNATGVIATTANQSLTLGASGTGNLVFAPGGSTAFTAFANGRIGIGTANPLATLDIRTSSGTIPGASISGATAQASFLVDQSGNGDLFTASKSGATKFVINNNGNIQFAGTSNFLNTIATNATAARTYTLPDATGTLVLTGNTGTLQNKTLDNTNTVNLKDTNFSLQDDGDSTKVLNFQLSGITTGNTRTLTIPDANGTLCLQGSGSCGFALGQNYWQVNNGALSPFTNTVDLLLGATATTSAKFAFTGVNNGTPTASISANSGNNATFLSGAGVLGTTNAQTLQLGSSSTGNVSLNPGGTAVLTALANGNVGIGTANPLAKLDIRGNSSGTIPAASISANTSFATAIIDQSGVGDIFTASKSGKTNFVIKNDGSSNIYNANKLNFYTDNGATLRGFVGQEPSSSDMSILSKAASSWLRLGATNGVGFWADGNADVNTTPQMFLNNSGQLGIGTSFTVTNTLDINGGSTTDAGATIRGSGSDLGLRLNNSGTNGLNWYIDSTSNGSFYGPGKLTLGQFGQTPVLTLAGSTLGINTIATLGALDVRSSSGTSPTATISGATAQAALLVDQSGAGDLFTASKSGATKFVINNAGDVQISNLAASNNNSVLFTDNSGILNKVSTTTGNLCLVSQTNSTPTWTTCPTGASQVYFQQNNGTLSPFSNTLDLLVGGTATTSAKFGFINVNNGTPTATISGTTTGVATYLDGNGNLGTTKAATLSLGTSSTGNVSLAPGGNAALTAFASGQIGINTLSPAAQLDVRANSFLNPVASFSGNTGKATLIVDNSGIGDIFTASSSGLTRFTIRQDGVAQLGAFNSSALPAYFYNAVASTNVNGNASYVGNWQSSNLWGLGSGSNVNGDNTLRLGQTSSNNSNVWNNTQSTRLVINGALGHSGLAALDIGGANATLPVASFSGSTNFAAQVVDQSGNGDLFTASKSGKTKFYVANNGNVVIGADYANAASKGKLVLTRPDSSSENSIYFQTLSNDIKLYQPTSSDDLRVFAQLANRDVLSITQAATVGINSTSPLAALDVRGVSGTIPTASFSATTAMASTIIDQSGVGDLFTASKSGATKFVINNAGNVGIGTSTPTALLDIVRAFNGNINTNITNTNSGSGAYAYYQATADNNAQIQFGIGSSGTTANVFNNRAFMYSNSNANGISLAAEGANKDIRFFAGNSNGGFVGAADEKLRISGTGTVATASVSASTSFAGLTVDNTGVGDLFTASKSGATKFVITNAGNIGIGQGVANQALDIAGGGIIQLSSGQIQDYTDLSFKIDADNNGTNVAKFLNGGGTQIMTLTEDGKLGLNTGSTTPIASLDIRANSANGGTTPIASISGKTSAASLMVDQSGVGDLITASVSGLTKFLVANSGNVGIGTSSAQRILDVSTNSNSVATPQLLIENGASGDSGLELRNATANSFFITQDASNSNALTINSKTAAVTSGSPVTLGYSAGTSVDSNGSMIQASQFTSSTNGSITSITVDFYDSDTAPNNTFSVGVYADNGSNKPGTLLGSSGTQAITISTPAGHNANTIAISPITITSGTKYWLAFNTDTINSHFWYNTSSGSTCWTATGVTNGTWPSTFTSSGTCPATNQYNVYASVTPGTTFSDANTNALFTLSQTGALQLTNAADSTSAFNVRTFAGTSVLNVDTSNQRVGIGTSTPVSKLDVEGGDIMIGQKTNTSVAADQTWSAVSATTGQLNSGGTTSIASGSASVVYNGSLYVGTTKSNAAEVYRYNNSTGSWTAINTTAGRFNTTTAIDAVTSMVVYNGELYIGTSEPGSAEIYKYTSGTGTSVFTKVSNATAGTIGGTHTAIDGIVSMAVYNGKLYAGSAKAGAADLFAYQGGTTWKESETGGGFCGGNNADKIDSMAVYQNYLYVGTSLANGGAQLCKIYSDNATSGTGYSLVNSTPGTFNDFSQTVASGTTAITGLSQITSMVVYNGRLYLAFRKATGGADLLRYDGSTDSNQGNFFTRVINTSGTVASGGTSSIMSISSMAVSNGQLFIGTEKTNAAEIYRYGGGGGTSSVWTKVSQATAGTIGSGATASIDMVGQLVPYNNSLYAMTFDTANNKAEVYQNTVVKDQSYSLLFHAGSANGGGEQNSLLNTGSISFIASASGMTNSTGGNTGAFLFSHTILTQNGAYDLAEDYGTRDTSLEAGDLVAADPNETDMVKKASGSADTVLGIYSEKPGFRLSQGDSTINGGTAVPIALAGRVPLKVTTENGPIKPGDMLTASDIPGVAKKATKAGSVVARSLGFYDNSDPKAVGKVSAFVNLSWWDPGVQLSSTGNVQVNGKPLSTETLQAAFDSINAQDSSKLADLAASTSAQFATLNDRQSTNSAQLLSLNDSVSSISGQLNSLSQRVSALESMASGSALLGGNIGGFVASAASDLNLDKVDINSLNVFKDLTVLGKTTLSDLGVTGHLTVGLLGIDGLQDNGSGQAFASINTSAGPLKIQSQALNGVDFFDGKVQFATNGDIKTEGAITTKKINIDTPDVASASLGTATLPAGTTKITVTTSALTSKSKVFVQAEDVPVTTAVKKIANNKFEIRIVTPQAEDMKLDWWIVN